MLNYTSSRTSGMADFRREVDRLFDDFWLMPTSAPSTGVASTWSPATDIEEGTDHFMLSLEVPGIKKEQLKIEVVENQVLVSGERKNEESTQGKGRLYSERSYGKFQRVFALPTNVDPGKIEAQYQEGILKVFVPKTEASKPRQVKIVESAPGSLFERFLGKKESESKTIEHSTGTGVV